MQQDKAQGVYEPDSSFEGDVKLFQRCLQPLPSQKVPRQQQLDDAARYVSYQR